MGIEFVERHRVDQRVFAAGCLTSTAPKPIRLRRSGDHVTRQEADTLSNRGHPPRRDRLRPSAGERQAGNQLSLVLPGRKLYITADG